MDKINPGRLPILLVVSLTGKCVFPCSRSRSSRPLSICSFFTLRLNLIILLFNNAYSLLLLIDCSSFSRQRLFIYITSTAIGPVPSLSAYRWRPLQPPILFYKENKLLNINTLGFFSFGRMFRFRCLDAFIFFFELF